VVVDGRKGTLHSTWIDSMKAEMVGIAVNGCWLSAETGQIVNRDFELISRALCERRRDNVPPGRLKS
jgi:hypothetical protein